MPFHRIDPENYIKKLQHRLLLLRGFAITDPQNKKDWLDAAKVCQHLINCNKAHSNLFRNGREICEQLSNSPE